MTAPTEREAQLTRELLAARALLCALARYEQTGPHGHTTPCVWDRDNAPGTAGARCARCIAFRAARRMLGLGDAPLPAGPTVDGGLFDALAPPVPVVLVPE